MHFWRYVNCYAFLRCSSRSKTSTLRKKKLRWCYLKHFEWSHSWFVMVVCNLGITQMCFWENEDLHLITSALSQIADLLQKNKREAYNEYLSCMRVNDFMFFSKMRKRISQPKALCVSAGLPWWIRWLLYDLPISLCRSLAVDWNRIQIGFSLLTLNLAEV